MGRRLVAALAAAALTLGLLSPTPASAELDPLNGWDYRAVAVGGTYQVVTGQFGGDLATDILFYGPGTLPDSLWIGRSGQRGSGAFIKENLSIGGNYQLLVGDFAGDDYDDLLFYGVGAAIDPLWVSVNSPARFDKTRKVSVGGTYQPKVLRDYRAQGTKDAVLFLGPGAAPDYYWNFTDRAGQADYFGPGTYTSRFLKVNGAYQLVVGDYNGDRIEDVFLYQPGAAFDYLWTFNAAGVFTQRAETVNGTYQPVVVQGSTYDGILWWGNGGTNSYWITDGRAFGARPITTPSYGPGVARPFGLGGASITSPTGIDIAFYGDRTQGGFFRLASDAHDQTTALPLLGNFDNDADRYLDVLWYGAGSAADDLWYGIDRDTSFAGSAETRGAPAAPRIQAKDLGVPAR